jgi:hypothetical protein
METYSLAEKGRLLHRLITDEALSTTADYEKAIMVAVPVVPLSSIERLASSCLLRLSNSDCADEKNDHAPLLVVARIMGQPLEALVVSALRCEVSELAIERQVAILEAVAEWAESFQCHAASRRRSAAELIRAWAGDGATAASLAEAEAGLARLGVTELGAQRLFELAAGPDFESTRKTKRQPESPRHDVSESADGAKGGIENDAEWPYSGAAEEKPSSRPNSQVDSNIDAKEDGNIEGRSRLEQITSERKLNVDELAAVLGFGSEWAFLADLDPRTGVLWRIVRRLTACELGPREEQAGECEDRDRLQADVFSVLAEVRGVLREDFVAEASRLLSRETMRQCRAV